MKEFFTTLQGKAITGLTIIALIMVIVLEGIQIQTAYYNLIRTKGEARITEQKSDYMTTPMAHMTREEEAKRACKEGLDLPGLHCE